MISKTKIETKRAATYNFKKTINTALVVYKKKENIRITNLNKDRIKAINTVVNRFNYDLEKSLNKIAPFTSKPPTAKTTYNKNLSQLTKYFRNMILPIQTIVNG